MKAKELINSTNKSFVMKKIYKDVFKGRLYQYIELDKELLERLNDVKPIGSGWIKSLGNDLEERVKLIADCNGKRLFDIKITGKVGTDFVSEINLGVEGNLVYGITVCIKRFKYGKSDARLSSHDLEDVIKDNELPAVDVFYLKTKIDNFVDSL